MRILPLLLLAVLFLAGCEKANANDTAGGCEGGTCEEHACHCEMKMSEMKNFTGNLCPEEFPVMQGHRPVSYKGQIVQGVQCRAIVHKCDCDHAE